MTFKRSTEFLLAVRVSAEKAENVSCNYHYYVVNKQETLEGDVILYLEGTFKVMSYFARVAKYRDKIPVENIRLVYQGEFSKTPKEQNKWIVG
jgi:hypothetical protein